MPPRPRAPTETVSLRGVRRADHVVDGEAQRVLVVGVAVDAQVGGVPGGVPRRAVPPQQLVVADVARPLRGRGARPPATAPWCARRRSRRAGPRWPGRPARGARRSRRAPAAACARRASRAPGWSSPRARARRRCGRACSRSDPAGRRAPRTRVSLVGPPACDDADGALPDDASRRSPRAWPRRARPSPGGRPARRTAPCARGRCGRCAAAAATSGRRCRGACPARARGR